MKYLKNFLNRFKQEEYEISIPTESLYSELDNDSFSQFQSEKKRDISINRDVIELKKFIKGKHSIYFNQYKTDVYDRTIPHIVPNGQWIQDVIICVTLDKGIKSHWPSSDIVYLIEKYEDEWYLVKVKFNGLPSWSAPGVGYRRRNPAQGPYVLFKCDTLEGVKQLILNFRTPA